MLQHVFLVISLGNHSRLAGCLYLGLGLALLPSVPDLAPVAQASIGCPAGMICCEDGTSGDATTCCCCSADNNSVSTVACQP